MIHLKGLLGVLQDATFVGRPSKQEFDHLRCLAAVEASEDGEPAKVQGALKFFEQ